MLSAKPWKAEAVGRFILSIFICVFAGSFIASGIQNFTSVTHRSVRCILLISMAVICLAVSVRLLQKNWAVENVARRLIIFLVCFYAGLSLGLWGYKLAGPVGPTILQMVIATLSFQGMSLLLATYFLREHDTTWISGFGFSNRLLSSLLLGIIVGCLFVPIGQVLQSTVAKIVVHLHLIPEEQQVVRTLQTAHGPVARFWSGIATILIAPPGEELIFRGILYPWLKNLRWPRTALWGTSALFALIHFNVIGFIPLMLLAVTLVLLYEKTGNLLAPITAHMVFNSINFLQLFMQERSWH